MIARTLLIRSHKEKVHAGSSFPWRVVPNAKTNIEMTWHWRKMIRMVMSLPPPPPPTSMMMMMMMIVIIIIVTLMVMPVIIVSVFVLCFSTADSVFSHLTGKWQQRYDGDGHRSDSRIFFPIFFLLTSVLWEQVMRPPRLCLSLFPLLQVRTLRSLPWLCGLLSAWLCVCWCCSSLWLPSAAGRSRRAARRPEEKVRPTAESRASCSAQMQTMVREREMTSCTNPTQATWWRHR